MNSFLILLGKTVLFLSKSFNLGSGSTWPGHVAMETNPRFLKQVLNKNPNLKTILVAGTNGKTTTSLLLEKMLEENGLRVFRNEAGANLLNGMASSVIERASISGKLDYDVVIFETDENNFPLALKEIHPHTVVLLNLFRDQLDRYGEVNTIAEKWESALLTLPKETVVVSNGDDPKLSYIVSNLKNLSIFFGIEEKLMEGDKNPYDVDFTYCPSCQTKLDYKKTSYSHLGKFKCPKCGYTNPKADTYGALPHPLFGKYNIYNINAASLVAEKVFDVGTKSIKKALSNFSPAFGRQEIIKKSGRDIIMLLSKNPAGFNQSIQAINELNKKGSVLLVLNDRIPDGRDVSWIWDIDIENIPPNLNVFISGDRAYDMALRVKYTKIDKNSTAEIFENLETAVKEAVDKTEKDQTLFILPTYSAMLEARKILTGRSIL